MASNGSPPDVATTTRSTRPRSSRVNALATRSSPPVHSDGISWTTRIRGLLSERMEPVGASAGYLAMRAYQRARLLRARLRGPATWAGVRILGYHRIADEKDVLAVRGDRFRRQLEL